MIGRITVRDTDMPTKTFSPICRLLHRILSNFADFFIEYDRICRLKDERSGRRRKGGELSVFMRRYKKKTLIFIKSIPSYQG